MNEGAEFRSCAEFAGHIRNGIERHLSFADARVSFNGSFANDHHDELSDIDLLAEVHCELDEMFFSSLERFLTRSYGSALIRYDPDNIDTSDFQHVRFSFYELPIFWRVDLDVSSDRDIAHKYPESIPEWQSGTSALMNFVWAIKYNRRGDEESADHYLNSACEKLDLERMPYSLWNAGKIVDCLEQRSDVDLHLLAKTRPLLIPD